MKALTITSLMIMVSTKHKFMLACYASTVVDTLTLDIFEAILLIVALNI